VWVIGSLKSERRTVERQPPFYTLANLVTTVWIVITGCLLIIAVIGVAMAVRYRRIVHHAEMLLRAHQADGKAKRGGDGVDQAAAPDHPLLRDMGQLLTDCSRLLADHSDGQQRFAAILDTIQESVIVVDDEDRVYLANATFRRVFPAQWDITGERVGLVLRNESFANYLAAVRRGEPASRREIEFLSGDQTVWMEVIGSRLPRAVSSRVLCLFVLHDVTRLKRLESIRKEFVANVSHELRTPITLIKGYAETLADAEHPLSPADQRRFLGIMEKHANRLHMLLEDLLALSRLEGRAASMHLEQIDLGDLLRDVVASYQPVVNQRQQLITLQLEAGARSLPVDVSKITQVLGNLIDNAVKYSPQGATITIATKVRADGIEVWVRDTGPGISAADLPHIFERFYRVDKGRSRETGGTGLGLSIVKHIVQLHGGKVWVESKLGKGTNFAFLLPYTPPKPTTDASGIVTIAG
jgi:two-component system, OmpR family, phosphate regulon sensor histidine kinase PhoR